MTTFQNPLGSLMPVEKKRELVALLARHEIPLIEDDVYAELHHGPAAPESAKAFDRTGLVLHRSSFSKCLAPGYRVGWTAAGRFARQVERLKLMTSLSGSIPAQAAVAEYLNAGGYDRHLRTLRQTLKLQQDSMSAAICRHFPKGTRLTQPAGGYFLWVELPPHVDALALHQSALQHRITLAPGPLFSARLDFEHCIRLNCGHPWTPQLEHAIATLGRLAAPPGKPVVTCSIGVAVAAAEILGPSRVQQAAQHEGELLQGRYHDLRAVDQRGGQLLRVLVDRLHHALCMLARSGRSRPEAGHRAPAGR
jgi:DNA-binding transcriptional MocR family regulator